MEAFLIFRSDSLLIEFQLIQIKEINLLTV